MKERPFFFLSLFILFYFILFLISIIDNKQNDFNNNYIFKYALLLNFIKKKNKKNKNKK